MKKKFNLPMIKMGGGLLAGMLVPASGWACACGCGVFDVGGDNMLPSRPGGMAYLEYDYQDQDQNWSGISSAPAANNGDKEIVTHFVTLGMQYMFNRSWGVEAEVPYWDRFFKTDANFPTGPQDIVTRHWSSLGDIRLKGIYTGFSPDLSTGVTFGLKLPTGDYKYDSDVVDRDSEIGSGSTDLLLGGFHRGNLTKDDLWSWFTQAQLDLPVVTQDGYRPGTEVDAALGIDYQGWVVHGVRISPVLQAIASERTSDGGPYASGGADDSPGTGASSGYQRVLISPGVEFHLHPVKVYADVEVPVYEHFTGDQLVAPVLFKVAVSYMF
jgi:hypothetical protein